jgi:hypothetical protein
LNLLLTDLNSPPGESVKQALKSDLTLILWGQAFGLA